MGESCVVATPDIALARASEKKRRAVLLEALTTEYLAYKSLGLLLAC